MAFDARGRTTSFDVDPNFPGDFLHEELASLTCDLATSWLVPWPESPIGRGATWSIETIDGPPTREPRRVVTRYQLDDIDEATGRFVVHHHRTEQSISDDGVAVRGESSGRAEGRLSPGGPDPPLAKIRVSHGSGRVVPTTDGPLHEASASETDVSRTRIPTACVR